MSGRKKIKAIDDDVFMNIKIWKDNGPEQKILEEMFSNGTITSKDTPSKIRASVPVFQEYSAQVFAAHFRKTKNKNANDLTEILGEKQIHSTEKNIDKITKKGNPYSLEMKEDLNAEFGNPPIGKWSYFDHQKKCTNVFVAITMFSGVSDIKFELSDDGEEVTIFYVWPTSLFRVEELFNDEITSNAKSKIDVKHPKIYSYSSALLDAGITEKTFPTGYIKVKLPVRVQKEIHTWKKQALTRANGAKIVLLQFKGFQQDQIIQEADTSIIFD